MKLYEWMVKPTAQREWIESKGILLWLAFFFIELGAGTFFVATFFESLETMLIGWLVCGVLGGGAHILYLGHPFRFWRMVAKPGTSWISRGLIFVSLFLILGLIQMVLVVGGGSLLVLTVFVDIFAFLTIVYGGFAMNYVNGIPLWNTALLPILYAVSGIWGGAGLALVIALATGAVSTIGIPLEEWIRLLLVAYIVLLAVYLVSVRYTNLIGKISVRGIVSGEYWPLMWLVVVLLGLLFPIAVVGISFITGIENMPAAVLYLAIFCELIGDLTLRYLILKQGVYAPLVSSSAYMRLAIICTFLLLLPTALMSQEAGKRISLDEKARTFLETRRGTWRDLNVPASDGKILYDLIVKNNYKKALEIGTSTGHSGIWIAWALSKTGGKLITIEIDRGRHQEAGRNFKEAGLADYIDARLADAHDLVKELKGPFDFIFCDADKEWYKNYFIDLYPKLEAGGRYTAHNVSTRRGWGGAGTREFYDYIKNLPSMETTVDESGGGLSISYKKF